MTETHDVQTTIDFYSDVTSLSYKDDILYLTDAATSAAQIIGAKCPM